MCFSWKRLLCKSNSANIKSKQLVPVLHESSQESIDALLHPLIYPLTETCDICAMRKNNKQYGHNILCEKCAKTVRRGIC